MITLLGLSLVSRAAVAESSGGAMLKKLRWPLSGSIVVTAPFGELRKKGPHNGTDLRAAIGTPVIAMNDGEIITAWNDNTYGGGLSLRVKYVDGYSSGFAHLSKNNVLPVGAKVKQGDTVALSGNTGTSTAPHLHVTMRDKNGTLVNLENLIKK